MSLSSGCKIIIDKKALHNLQVFSLKKKKKRERVKEKKNRKRMKAFHRKVLGT